MNASMSSRRTYAPEIDYKLSGKGVYLAVFVLGLVCTYLAAKTNSSVCAGLGFLGIAAALLHWNSLLWIHIYDKKDEQK